jgi:NADPH:quinone reductase-like Zn-dependent oxidoreductase
MLAIVQDEWGPAPEDVLRLAEAERPVALRALIDSGNVVPVIDRTYPLSDVAAAIRYLIDGHATGKLVITV